MTDHREDPMSEADYEVALWCVTARDGNWLAGPFTIEGAAHEWAREHTRLGKAVTSEVRRVHLLPATPPEGEAVACDVVEYDGAFKCLTHGKTWGAILNPTGPCTTHPLRATVTEGMVAAGCKASQHITDQYGSTEFVPSDVVHRILTAALATSKGVGE